MQEQPTTTCTVDGCTKPRRGAKYCPMHYTRVYRTGSTERRTPVDLTSIDGEVWMPIDGWDAYEVSNFGRVRRSIAGHTPATILHPITDSAGYKQLGLYKGPVRSSIRVHVLVARAFIPNPESKPTVNHIDFDRSNNHLGNLEWATRREQMVHRYSRYIHRQRAPGKKYYYPRPRPITIFEATCPECGVRQERTRRFTYCSRTCKERAHHRRRRAK